MSLGQPNIGSNNPLLSTSYGGVDANNPKSTAAASSANPSAYVANAIYNYVLKTKASVGIGGFKLDYTGEQAVALEAEITDHFVEDNTAVQDHVALKPLRFTVRGMVSELTIEAPAGIKGLLSSMQSGLSQVQAYIGKYTPGMVQTMQKAITQAQNVTNEVSQDLSKAQNIIAMFPGVSVPTSFQETAFNKLFAAYLSRIPIQVDTPYGTLINMMIERITISQPDSTTGWSDILVTVKQMRFVSISTVPDDGSMAGRLQAQASGPSSQGTVPSNPAPTSLAVTAAKGMGWLN